MVIRRRKITNRRGNRTFAQKHPYHFCEACDSGWRIFSVSVYRQEELPFQPDLGNEAEVEEDGGVAD
jgi:hypothetical protein